MKDATLYVPVHAGIWDHPKTRRLARRLGVHDVEAVGHLVALWTWTVHYAPDGDLSDLEPEEIEEAARWRGEPRALFDVLVATGWLEDGRLSGWEDHAGEGLSMRAGARERQRAKRAGLTVDEYRARQRDGHVTVTAPSRGVTPDRDHDRDLDQDREGESAPAAPPAPAPVKPIDPNRPEPLGPYGEKYPNDLEKILAFEHQGERLEARWAKAAPELGRIGLRRSVEAAMNYRATLEGARLRQYFWPGGFISRLDSWIARDREKKLRELAAEGRAQQVGAVTGSQSAEKQDPRRAKLLAWWKKHAGPDDLPPFPTWIQRAEGDGTADRIISGAA